MNNFIYILITQGIHDDVPIISTTFVYAKDIDEAETKGYEYFKNKNPKLMTQFVNDQIIQLPKL